MTGTHAPAAPAHGYVALPEGWERLSARGPGPFVTNEVLRRPDGTLVYDLPSEARSKPMPA